MRGKHSEESKIKISLSKKGNSPAWNKGKKLHYKVWNKGKTHPTIVGKNHWYWKGDKVGYVSLHYWVQRHGGTPRLCSDCGITTAKKYYWANISGKYKRDLKDFKRLCASCHKFFDYNQTARGARVGTSKLNEKDVVEIRKLIARGMSQGQIAKQFNISQSTISLIFIGKSWKHA